MKKLLTVLLSIMMLCTLAACGGGETTTDENTKTTVTVWSTYTKDQKDTIEAAAAAFNESQDKYEVVIQSQDNKDFSSKVMQAVRNQNGPDIIINYASEAANYVNDGLVIDFADYLDVEAYKATVNAASFADATSFVDGKMHIYPVITTGPAFIYNKTIYDELGLKAPATWEELEANCEAVKAAYPDKFGFAFDSLTDGMQTLFMQTGSEYIDIETKTTQFNNEANVERLAWFAENVQNGNFMLEPTDGYFSGDFCATTLVSYIGSIAGVPYLADLATNFGHEYALAPLPQGQAVEWTPAWHRGGIVFTSTPEREAGAVEFLQFFTSAEWNGKFCAASNYLTPYHATLDNADYQAFIETAPGTDVVKASYDTGIAGTLPNVLGASTARKALEQAALEAATGLRTPAEALENAAQVSDAELAG